MLESLADQGRAFGRRNGTASLATEPSGLMHEETWTPDRADHIGWPAPPTKGCYTSIDGDYGEVSTLQDNMHLI